MGCTLHVLEQARWRGFQVGRSRLDQNPPRTNAKGDPLTLDVTGPEEHEVKGYEA